MSHNELSVRQWQERYQAGAFDSKDMDIQHQAGWWDWSCHFDALAGRLKRIAPVVTGITEPLILDNYSIWFANVLCTDRNASYDHVQFEPLDKEHSGWRFRISYGDPNEPEKWTLYTERFGFNAPEFGCAHVREMVKYVSVMACELEKGIRPPFLEEKAAAVDYILGRDVLYPSRALRREGEHSYSFLDRDDGRRKTVHVARSMENVPPDFDVSRALVIQGLYVYCPEDTEKAPPAPQKAANKSHKRKEAER